jgi:hypothetical protein
MERWRQSGQTVRVVSPEMEEHRGRLEIALADGLVIRVRPA